MFVDKKSPVPVYYQLSAVIRRKIREGEFPEGALIPSERELSESLGISRMTVRQALTLLVNEGVLVREKGKGTFVSREKIVQRNIMSFSDTVRAKGMTPSTTVLYFEKHAGDVEINKLLEIPEGEALYRLKRLRLADAKPIAIEESYLPERYFPNLEQYDLKASLYSLLRDAYAMKVHYMDNTLAASQPTKEERALLKLSASVPVLRISGLNYSASGMKLFYEKDVYRSDEYNYSARIFMHATP